MFPVVPVVAGLADPVLDAEPVLLLPLVPVAEAVPDALVGTLVAVSNHQYFIRHVTTRCLFPIISTLKRYLDG